MSLINNVLKDLESKPSAFAPIDLAAPVAEPETRFHNSAIWFVIGLVVLLLVTLAVTVNKQWLLDRFVAQPVAPAVLDNPEPNAVQAAAEKSLLEPGRSQPQIDSAMPSQNTLDGLQIRRTADLLELVFQLQSRVQAALTSQAGNAYRFRLQRVKNAIVTPDIRQNAWLSDIELTQQAAHVDIRFEVQPGVSVETRQSPQQDDFSWTVRFTRATPAKALVTDQQPDNTTPEKTMVAGQRPGQAAPARLDKPVANSQPVAQKPDRLEQVQRGPQAPADESVRVSIREVGESRPQRNALQQAMHLLKQGRGQDARSKLEGLLGGSQDRAARLQLIALLGRPQDLPLRAELITEGIQRYPRDVELMRLEAERLFALKDFQQLVERFSSVTDDVTIISLVANSLQRLNRHQQAIDFFQQLLRIDVEQARTWVSLGISQQHHRQPAQALQSYRMAMQMGLDNARIREFVDQRIRQLAQ